ncbi:hypothetical protein F4801DRAFT_583834 [Xylaria longipes]|nr:hypothetical protein F4801DRAFT_583834 [Xylaria longipes]RYC61826.1 hypothetical protein CHU98_g4380 [Xylaria longipes]
METTLRRRRFGDTVELLRYVYQDITRLSEVASPYICSRIADRNSTVIRGIDGVQARMEALKGATGGTLFMDVEKVLANRKFGVVFGVMRAQRPGLQDLAMRFCGIWRFVDGIVVEHSESLSEDSGKLEKWLWHARYPPGN